MQHLTEQIFNCKNNFNNLTKDIFKHQINNNELFKNWAASIQRFSYESLNLESLPFLPISFFKTHKIIQNNLNEVVVFESSGTTQTINSKHFIADIELYKKSFLGAFEMVYGKVEDWCILGLLPSYLERNNSSLVFMVDELIKRSKDENSGFYLNDFEKLHETLQTQKKLNKKTLLIGVTFALLDFAENYNIDFKELIVMETGGMKGRKKEMTKDEVHFNLKKAFNIENIHSEYGMTELLSQAYSIQNQIHVCPPWMKVLVRSEDDPFDVKLTGRGVINVIDLANIYSCSFIATEDIGEVYEDGSFRVFGRLDASDIRGCSLLYL